MWIICQYFSLLVVCTSINLIIFAPKHNIYIYEKTIILCYDSSFWIIECKCAGFRV